MCAEDRRVKKEREKGRGGDIRAIMREMKRERKEKNSFQSSNILHGVKVMKGVPRAGLELSSKLSGCNSSIPCVGFLGIP